jgi:hypothetical protein
VKSQVAHWCGNRACVAPGHLRWANAKENRLDRLRHGTEHRGSRHIIAKLTEADVSEIRRRPWRKGRDLADELGVAETTISAVRSGRSWHWLPS